MDVMLDTCALLSLVGLVEKKLGKKARAAIRAADEVFISSCSLFEIALKHKKETLDLGIFASAEELWNKAVAHYRLTVIPVDDAHFLQSVMLPDHHADPFDRIIIAQARRRKLAVLTFDASFDQYEVDTLA